MDLAKNLPKGSRENELMVHMGKLNDTCKCTRLNFKKMNLALETLYIWYKRSEGFYIKRYIDDQ